jgi:hypothetical protein
MKESNAAASLGWQDEHSEASIKPLENFNSLL